MTSQLVPLTSGKINNFCEGELSSVLTAAEVQAMQGYLAGLLDQGQSPPRWGRGVDIAAVAGSAGVDVDRLKAAVRFCGHSCGR